jgi:pimeloyl-ACP methyl ester carboxylesterase
VSTARSRTVVTRDGTRLHAIEHLPADRRAPDPASAPAFLLVHGLASNATLWDGVGAGLSAAGHRAVAVDQRSHGRSDPSDRLDLATLTDDLLDVAAALDLGRPVVVGQSWGGNVAVELASRAPARIRAVVAVDGGTIELADAFPDVDAAWEALAPPDWDELAVPYARLAADAPTRHPGWPEAGWRAQLANLAVRPDGTATAVLRREHHRTILADLFAHRPSALFADLTVPLLLLPVDDGASTGWASTKRAGVERAVASNPLVTAGWITDRSHDVHAEAPDEVVARLRTALRDGALGGRTPTEAST